MSKAVKNILALNHEEAMDFFVKFKQFHSFELKEYYYKLKGVLVEIEMIVIRFSEQMVRNIGPISRWIANQVQPSVEQLYKIAHRLDVNVKDLLKSSKEE